MNEIENNGRQVWIDWLRVIACFMVMVVHSSEPFYIGGDGALIESWSDALWASFFDTFVRSCVPLFVIASSFLQFPLHYPTKTFFKKRALRVIVPLLVWSLFYAFYWGEPVSNLKNLLFNFNFAAGHLWFVYMLLGLYLLMPLLSPWAQKVGKKELSFYIGIWLISTLVPLVRDWAATEPLAITFGPTGIPRQALLPLWGEACWNSYGLFYYVSGFFGYLLVGLWLRKFGDSLSPKKSFAIGIPSFVAGFAICFFGFLRRVNQSAGGCFPVEGGYTYSVWWETTWCYDTLGVALMTIGGVLMLRNIKSCGGFYRRLVLPVSNASYGMYLGHMVALSFYATLFRNLYTGLYATPLTIVSTAVCSFVTVALIAVPLRKIPVLGKAVIG